GVVLARSRDEESWVGRDISRLSSTAITMRERDGVREVLGVDGVNRLSGYATAHRVPWHVYVGIPREIALAPVAKQKREALALAFMSLLLSLVLAWLLARRIAGPVLALTTDADAFASGDLGHRSHVHAAGELGQLAATFNRMA